MRKLSLLLLLGMMFIFPSFVSAQNNITIANMTVQLWPEYDQPSMLVIADFQLDSATALPVDVTFSIPEDANLDRRSHAVAADGSFLNAVHLTGPTEERRSGKTFTVTISQSSVYRFEYYQPLTLQWRPANLFLFVGWRLRSGRHSMLIVLEPNDVTAFSMDSRL
jgi:hypothetical protein